MSDAITDSYTSTKDLFTLCCGFVAMVLDYDVTIKVLGFLIVSRFGLNGVGWGGYVFMFVCLMRLTLHES